MAKLTREQKIEIYHKRKTGVSISKYYIHIKLQLKNNSGCRFIEKEKEH